MTNNLGTARIADGQAASQWATSNDADGAHDAAMTEKLTIAFDSTSETLTALQFISNFTFHATAGSPAPGAGCTLNVPNVNAESATLKRGAFTVINDTGQDLTVQVSGQSETPPTLEDGQASILVMDGSDVRLAVPQGSVGGDGADAGIRWAFDTSTDTASDPGAGDLRLNNATLSSVTEIGLDDEANETGNPDVSAWLATWDDSTSSTKGHVIIKKTDAAENFAIYAVTGATDASTHWRMTVSHVASSGSFSSADDLSVQFFPKGNVGAGSTIAVAHEGESPEVINASTETIRFGEGFTVTDDGGGQVTVGGGGGTFSGALVTKSADETGADYTSVTALTWDVETYDEGGWFDTGVSTSAFTVPSGVSRIRVSASVSLSNITENRWVRLMIFKNGSLDYVGATQLRTEVGISTAETQVTSPVLSVSTGDTFDARLHIESDTSIDVDATRSWFAIEKVA